MRHEADRYASHDAEIPELRYAPLCSSAIITAIEEIRKKLSWSVPETSHMDPPTSNVSRISGEVR